MKRLLGSDFNEIEFNTVLILIQFPFVLLLYNFTSKMYTYFSKWWRYKVTDNLGCVSPYMN